MYISCEVNQNNKILPLNSTIIKPSNVAVQLFC